MSTPPPGAPPAKPRLVLRVGAIGKIRFREPGTGEALRTTSREILRQIGDRLRMEATDPETREFFSKEAPVLRVISSLAAGTDQIIAQSALDLQEEPVETGNLDLHCVLPFKAATYRDESVKLSLPGEEGIQAAKRVDDLLAKAAHVVEIDGLCPKEDQKESEACRHRAYRAAAWFLLQQSDILIAVFDAKDPELPGGTIETVKQALRSSIPVLWVDYSGTPDARGLLPLQLLKTPRDLEARSGVDSDWKTATAGMVKMLVTLPDPSEAGKNAKEKEKQREAMRTMREFYAQDMPGDSYRNRIWKTFMKIVAGNSAPSSAPSRPIEPYETCRKRAALLSRFYTNRYRGAFLLNFILLVAIVVLAMGFESLAGLEFAPVWLALVKLGMILYIYWNAFFANNDNWHRKGIDFRVLSDSLRSSNYLAPLGVATPNARLPVQYSLNELQHSWSQWLFRSIVRAEPIISLPDGSGKAATLSGEALGEVRTGLTDHWMQGQIDHHRNKSVSMGKIFSRLENLSRWLIRLMLLAVIAQAALEIYRASTGSDTGSHLWGWLVFIGAVMPAFVASCAGVVYQSESQRLSERSAAMARKLTQWQEELREVTPHPFGCDSWVLARDALSIAKVMADETADWHLMHQAHEVGVV